MPAHSTIITLDTKFKLCIIKDNNDAIFPVSFMTLRKMPNKKKDMNLKLSLQFILGSMSERKKEIS